MPIPTLRRLQLILSIGIVVAVYCAHPALAASGDSSAASEAGKQIYRNGILPNGHALRGESVGGVELAGKDVSCERCHRRSGMGGHEGKVLVPPIAGPLLFAEAKPLRIDRPGRNATPVMALRSDSRPAYTDITLANALRKGIDPLNRPLNPLMPRFRIDDNALKSLSAYLRHMSDDATTGIDGSTMHLATIVTPEADTGRRDAVTKTLQAWAARGGFLRVAVQLHVWSLEGPKSSWKEQLERHYRDRPVYAVLSGAGGANWAPIHEFCEQTRLPCLFPVIDRAEAAPDDVYSMYFSSGVLLEAGLMANYLHSQPHPPVRVVQVVADDAGAAAARQLQTALNGIPVVIRSWDEKSTVGLAKDLRKDDLWIGWLKTAQLQSLASAFPRGLPTEHLLLSAQLAPPERLQLPEEWREHALWASVHTEPSHLHGHTVLGLLPWLERIGMELIDEAVQSEVYAAVFFFGDAQARMRGSLNRDYVLEMLERTVDDRPAGASYYHLSLAPGQRFASRSGHMLGFIKPDYTQIAPIGRRLIP